MGVRRFMNDRRGDDLRRRSLNKSLVQIASMKSGIEASDGPGKQANPHPFDVPVDVYSVPDRIA
jgi:hypothetical protein